MIFRDDMGDKNKMKICDDIKERIKAYQESNEVDFSKMLEGDGPMWGHKDAIDMAKQILDISKGGVEVSGTPYRGDGRRKAEVRFLKK